VNAFIHNSLFYGLQKPEPSDEEMTSKQSQSTFEPSQETSLSPGLYIVATPIGNAADITLRALNILARADIVACEDTRVTGKLMHLHGVKANLSAYHEHNAPRVRPELIKRLNNGETVALVSDAGTPLISDPGFKLVQACQDADIPVTPVPGASAVLSALVVSGLPTDRFLFAGFLPSKKTARRQSLEELSLIPATLVLMESPRRFAAMLADAATVMGSRSCVIARELTKMHEEIRRGTIDELAAYYKDAEPPKGEGMIVIGPPSEDSALSDEDLSNQIREALATKSLRDAVRDVIEATGVSKKIVYGRALELDQDGSAKE
jgi:16S rRNA (cytidine1402-2'-O)-methyltransferase